MNRQSQDMMKWVMNNRNMLMAGAAIAVGASAIAAALARKLHFSTSAFIEEASMKGTAEMETAKLALQKSSANDVKAFAQQMIDDHATVNKDLRAIAERKHLNLADDATLMDKAKVFVLKHKEGHNFDEAYAEHQVAAHKETVALFKKAAKCDDSEIRYFAALTLPKLQKHFRMAQDLLYVIQNRKQQTESVSHARPAGALAESTTRSTPSLSSPRESSSSHLN